MKNTILISTLLLCILTNFIGSVYANDNKPLSKKEATSYSQELYHEMISKYTESINTSWQARELQTGEYKMPFWYKITGEKPKAGYPMYISMHGGGGTTQEANDKQWSNQKRLYGDVDGLYFVPRSPTNTWNMWHQAYMDDFFKQAVAYAVTKLEVDPSRIYITGYSAGGDGTFQLAPRLADRYAAAAMMAGHPGDARAENLRNLPYAIYMGGKDTAYKRNELAVEWGNKLDELASHDCNAYIHKTVIYPEKGHWMDNEDKEAIGWMAQFVRPKSFDKIIWIQDDIIATRKYNLEVKTPKAEQEVIVSYNKETNTANIEKCDYEELTLWFNDNILNLDKKIHITYKGKSIFEGKLKRTATNIKESINNRYDSNYIFSAKITVTMTNKIQ